MSSLVAINRPIICNRICFVLKLQLIYNLQPIEHYIIILEKNK